jgi:hypothetical protein
MVGYIQLGVREKHYGPVFPLEAMEATISARLTAEVYELTARLKSLEAKLQSLEQRT